MKNLIFAFVFLFSTTLVYSQQLPLRIVNNTGQTITVNNLNLYGGNPLMFDTCADCQQYMLWSDPFDIAASQTIVVNSYLDFDTLDGGLPVPLRGGACGSTILPYCDGSTADFICDQSSSLPYWALVGFGTPTGGDGRVGDSACGYPSFDTTPGGINGSYQVIGGEVVVMFN